MTILSPLRASLTKPQMKKSQDDRTQMNANTFELLLAVVRFDINTIPSFVMLSILKSYFNCLNLITSPVTIHSRIQGKSLTFLLLLSHLHHLPRLNKAKLFSLTRDFINH